MPSRRTLFILQITALWLMLAALAVITFAAFITSSTRSDCDSSDTNDILTSNPCTFHEKVSATVHQYTTYFQSIHIIIIQTIATLSLVVFQPSLLAMTWSALRSSSPSSTGVEGLTMSAFQNGVDFANSPGLISSLLCIGASHSLNPHAAFVLVVSVLSLLSAIVVSPIYRSHTGPFIVAASIVNGGGVGPSISSTFSTGDVIPGGVVAGRTLISGGTILNSTVYPATFDNNVAPFIPLHTIQAIWYAQIETAVARNSLDCGSTAPMRLSNSSQNLVNFGDPYFSSNQGFNLDIPSFAGRRLGTIVNDAVLTTVYLNSTTKVVPGVVEAQTSVILLAPNGTLEGAQQRITSPEPTSRIEFVDVLVCTSTTRLETSICTINTGNVTACDFRPPTNLPRNNTVGGVDVYVNNPISVAITLSASPVTAYFIMGNKLPMLGINQNYIDSQTLPLSYLTSDTHNSPYKIPLTYVTDVLFAQTAQGLVQGMTTTWQRFAHQQVAFTVVFGTSQPMLLFVIMGVSLALALVATLASTLPRSARRAPKLDILKLLLISRNPQLDSVFELYLDQDVGLDGRLDEKLDKEMLEARVGYELVESLKRPTFVMVLPKPRTDSVTSLIYDQGHEDGIGKYEAEG